MNEQDRKKLRCTVLIIAGILLVVLTGAVLAFKSFHKENFDDEHITEFKADDIARAERIFDITVTDDVELKDLYIEKLPPDSSKSTLELVTTDYDKFLAKNLRTPVELKAAEDNSGRLEYTYANTYFSITSSEPEGGKYDVVLYKWKY